MTTPLRAAVLLILVSVAVHAPFLGGGLITDDWIHVSVLKARTSLGEVIAYPDGFDFYRPVTQFSLWLDMKPAEMDATAIRRTNLALHTLVVLAAFALARRLLGSTTAAALAAIAFALTPKAVPIAVLWISGRSDLLMSLFCLLAFLCWTRHQDGGPRHFWWLAGAAVGYGLAVLSKETAVLLPALFLLAPLGAPDGDPAPPLRRRLAACIPMAIVLGLAVALRLWAGALMPGSANEQYTLVTPAALWWRNFLNYVPRALPSPLGLLVFVGAPYLARRFLTGRADHQSLSPPRVCPTAWLLAFAAAWFAVFLLPVLGIGARNELYLYLPVFGLCLGAAHLVERLVAGGVRLPSWLVRPKPDTTGEGAGLEPDVAMPRPTGQRPWKPDTTESAAFLLLVVYVVGFAGYQMTRGAERRETAAFSAGLAEALRSNDAVRVAQGGVLLRAADAATEAHLRSAVSGYFDIVLRVATGLTETFGRTGYDPPLPTPPGVVLVCTYRNGEVALGGIE